VLRRPLKSFFTGSIGFATRVRVVVLLFIALSSLSANVGELKRTWELALYPLVDKISHYEKRFTPLKDVLPKRGVVGFVSDERNRVENLKRRYVAGYALAPVVVAPGADWPLVIGDFSEPTAVGRFRGSTLRVREDLGDGLFILAPEQ
jgi:hypothetical protein